MATPGSIVPGAAPEALGRVLRAARHDIKSPVQTLFTYVLIIIVIVMPVHPQPHLIALPDVLFYVHWHRHIDPKAW